MKILMVMTSQSRLGGTGDRTGVWLKDFAAPYYVFKDAKVEVTLASPAGGHPSIDPISDRSDNQNQSIRRLKDDTAASEHLTRTRKLANIDPETYDAVFYPGGRGLLWDLVRNEESRRLIDTVYAEGKPVAAVGHGVAAFREARGPFGLPLVRGKPVTGFSNSEEAAAGFSDVVPFLIEDMLKEHGGEYSKAADWQHHVVTSDNLITGQNPASSVGVAVAVLVQLGARLATQPNSA